MAKDSPYDFSLASSRLCGKIVRKPVDVFYQIVLQQRVHALKIADNPLQPGVSAAFKHFPGPAFQPVFTYPVSQADQCGQALVDLAVLCLYPALEGTAEFKPPGKFFLRKPQGFTDLDYSLVYVIFIFCQNKPPATANITKKSLLAQEKAQKTPLDNIFHETYTCFTVTFWIIRIIL